MAAWSPAATPSRAWPSESRADSPMMLTSASRATASPAPTATPLIADDDRLDRRQHRLDDRPGVPPLLDHGGVVGGHPLDHGQVPAGREGPAGTGDHRRRHRLVGVDDRPDLGELAVEPLVGGVEDVGRSMVTSTTPGRGVRSGGGGSRRRTRRGGSRGIGHDPIMRRRRRKPSSSTSPERGESTWKERSPSMEPTSNHHLQPNCWGWCSTRDFAGRNTFSRPSNVPLRRRSP